MPVLEQTGFLRRMASDEPPSVVIAELRRKLRGGVRFVEASNAAPPPPVSAGALFAKARRRRADRERRASEREAQKRQRLEAIERDEKGLWERVAALIAAKTIKAYDEAVGILKDLRALALHKQRLEEFVRRVETIRGRYPGPSGLQLPIKDAKLLEGLESK
jgi:hypothetical protein